MPNLPAQCIWCRGDGTVRRYDLTYKSWRVQTCPDCIGTGMRVRPPARKWPKN